MLLNFHDQFISITTVVVVVPVKPFQILFTQGTYSENNSAPALTRVWPCEIRVTLSILYIANHPN